MTCRNTDLIFDLRGQVKDLTARNVGLETALREQAAIATGEIERLNDDLAARQCKLDEIEPRLIALIERLERDVRKGGGRS